MIEKKNNPNNSKLSKKDFLKWIKTAEKSPTMYLEKFNEKWEEKNGKF
ncbi:hypothetical protein [Flavobacterium aquidurense]|uniref:Uncharacterized protein n=1 Tax=Flavobacterium aquidurense TaxID=362413 RepID=A0A0Q0XRZ1_9FLAO|nr:hypothetical protein [Flavobacterium aquidurense]KQB38746.1 hypothetical protein RC62_2109 [Flavobacterium aquidurense]